MRGSAIVGGDMSSPKADLSEGARGFRVEYVQTRGVLRVAGWLSGKQVVAPIEVRFADLRDQLGIQEAPSGPYLLFGGNDVRGGSRDFLAVYPDKAAARAAFTELRKGTTGGWAEVVHVVRDRLVQVCWFGQPRALERESRRGFLRRG